MYLSSLKSLKSHPELIRQRLVPKIVDTLNDRQIKLLKKKHP